jgi:carbon storage regulator
MEGRMPILTRKQNESVIIDDDIKVTVISNRHGHVKLGIEAPEEVEIWREEIYVQLQESHDGQFDGKISHSENATNDGAT